ncbi:major facilitator superfamily domain-containing protein [Plectosphaerella cucumerina]|uniref:Major facilitator superfamily domain-containing protein n=1 Tax=Plectosphaerella cucumerina TaxID=40658 RepID=A0A8K0TU62_9PEZI|nr:major facilitator superfamily domain-containing protein [Plectosphaerella cucumerina]
MSSLYSLKSSTDASFGGRRGSSSVGLGPNEAEEHTGADVSAELDVAHNGTEVEDLNGLVGDGSVAETESKIEPPEDIMVLSPRKRRWKRPGTPYPRSRARAVIKIIPLCLGNLACALDVSMLAVALPSVSAELGGSTLDAFWTATSFLLAAAVFQPLWSTQRDTSLAATAFLVAIVLFTLGSALALMARGFPLMLAARCVQGTGAGGVIALTYVILTNLFDAGERMTWFGVVALQWAVGTAAGPIIGGAVVQASDWRWIFWVNIPICLSVSVPIVLPVATAGNGAAWARARRTLSSLDWLGAFVFTASLTSVLTLFTSMPANAAWLGAVAHGILLYCLLFYLPLYFVAAKGYGPILVGLALLPYTLTTGIAAIVAGAVLSRVRMYRRPALFGWGATSLGTGLLVLLRVDTHDAIWVVISIVGGVGLGASWTATLSAAQALSADDDEAFVAPTFSLLRTISQAAGVGFGGALFQNALKNKIQQHPVHAPLADVWANDVAALVKAIGALTEPAERDLRMFLASAVVGALRVVFVGLCVLSSVVMVAMVIWVRDVTPTPGLRTETLTVGGEKTHIKTVPYPGPGDWF